MRGGGWSGVDTPSAWFSSRGKRRECDAWFLRAELWGEAPARHEGHPERDVPLRFRLANPLCMEPEVPLFSGFRAKWQLGGGATFCCSCPLCGLFLDDIFGPVVWPNAQFPPRQAPVHIEMETHEKPRCLRLPAISERRSHNGLKLDERQPATRIRVHNVEGFCQRTKLSDQKPFEVFLLRLNVDANDVRVVNGGSRRGRGKAAGHGGHARACGESGIENVRVAVYPSTAEPLAKGGLSLSVLPLLQEHDVA
mmetsp:Transcript_21076/g.58890  ORF Transcript_21076/g.58890 Transcript_21076/m.58890 type:complete len:252 (-) Transcript_21076:627-1382(-)